MPLQNKNRIAYLGALTLLFSYAEMMLPRVIPFFRIGFGNVIILLALPLDFSSFVILTLIKSVAACLMAGTLFSPFFLISISQSFISGLIMFLLFRVKGKWLSIYGISLAGSAVSAIIQIMLSSLYIGKGTFVLLGPMLIFSILSGSITAFLSDNLHIPEKAPKLSKKSPVTANSFLRNLLLIFVIGSIITTFMIKKILVLFILLIASIILQTVCGRKIKVLPHFFMWIFILIANVFVPSGKVVLEFLNISVTSGALMISLEKALKLSVAMCLSQCCFKLSFKQNSLINLVLEYFNGLSAILKNTQGNIILKLKAALQSENL